MSGSVRHIPLEEWWDPSRVFETLYGTDSHAFWLDAGADAQTGRSYLGAAGRRSRYVTACVADNTVSVCTPAGPGQLPEVSTRTIFDFLRDELPAPVSTGPDTGFDGEFQLGWVGWLGYELGAQTVGGATQVSKSPDAALLEIDRAIVFDHGKRTVTLVARTYPDDPPGTLDLWVQSIVSALRPVPACATPVATVARQTAASARWRHPPERYAKLIDECLLAIRAGDAYQVCLTNEITVTGRVDPAVAYRRLRESSPSHHGGLLRFGETALLSASPEQFLHVTPAGAVRTKPIKGTRPRSVDAGRDRDLAKELRSSDKECAENLMIVDLMRNDLGRVAALGSVAVTKLLAVESYPHVHQLVSTIEARLAPGLTGIDAVEACFPAGSMTGAPKRSAMSIIDALEDGPRGVYAGAFGYFGVDGSIDLAIVIRSIVLSANEAVIGTGGGITALSNAEEEIEETRVKAAALLAALGVRD
ncbi:aminodeoxychorismate synthase component I [Cryobacterium psychrophilum]|uniref:aminodeoxychorismate synthase n=1 Tax=Cryobacterium psychrophilum TaxID=41988 RepID=A0A4Y8KN09_9MICO|nr:aminodeoxychorismate synthase component I [Cryobacterium psychrophilum]TDW31523.1 anthranilate synthase component 1 [Cryobacterium psychrophilum]TFD79324.1 aminodeoxychorismate synthase component I [Cryobacterium psychrophilum]